MAPDLMADLAERGAVLAPFEGIELVAHFGDVDREWRAAREGAAMFPAGHRQLIAATGGDRVEFLQGMLSNDVKALAPGGGCYASLLNQTGKVITDLRVYADPDRLLLDVLAWRATALRESLERYLIADDVELADAAEQPLLQLEGPLARAVAGEALGIAELPRDAARARARASSRDNACASSPPPRSRATASCSADPRTRCCGSSTPAAKRVRSRPAWRRSIGCASRPASPGRASTWTSRR